MKIIGALCLPCFLFAQMEEMQVVAGSAKIEQVAPSTVEITVADDTILNYKSFHIEQDETVRFIQSTPHSKVLNRITGNCPSHILGRLESNGKVFFINPHGIFFGEHSQVDVGSLIASTLDIADEDFKKGKYHFQLANHAKRSRIFNQGHLKAGPEGEIVLLASYIKNEGIISAHAEKIALISAPLVTLDLGGDGYFRFAVEGELEEGVIEHLGQISASEGEVWMHLSTALRVVDAVVNKEGMVEGNFLTEENGVIKIKSLSQIEAKNVHLSSHKVDIAGEISNTAQVDIQGKGEVHFCHPLETGDFSVVCKHLQIRAPIKAQTVKMHADSYLIGNDIHIAQGSLVFDAPVLLSNGISLDCIQGDIVFQSSLDGRFSFHLKAPAGNVFFHGPVGETAPLSSLYVRAKEIDQNQSVKMGGPLTYQGTTFLGGNISNTNNKILFDGPVILGGQDRITLLVKGRGDVIFMSSLDGERKLSIRATEGSVQFNESIGKNCALKQLTLNTKSLSFKEIGGNEKGILGLLDVTASQVVDLHGQVYHASEQRWKAPQFNLLGKGNIQFFSEGNSIEFAQGELNVDHAFSLAFHTGGGELSFLGIRGRTGLDISVVTGQAIALLGSVTGGVKFFHAEAKEAILHGSIKAESVKIEATGSISNYAPHKIVATKDVILNARGGEISSQENALWIEAGHKIWIGAKNSAHIRGEFTEGTLCGISDNYPALFIFNDFEYYESAYEMLQEVDQVFSLAPEIVTGAREKKVDSALIELRRSSIYYGAPK